MGLRGVDFPEEFPPALLDGLVDFFTADFVTGFAVFVFTAFAARSRAAAIVCSKFAIIADFSLFTLVRSSTRICSSSFALFAAFS